MPHLPLTGLTVVSLEQAVAAPLCTRRLALAGARVIKVERPEGDFARYYDTAVAGESAYFVWLNGGKESICLDLRDSADVDVLLQLIRRCDVLVQNLKPGALERLGIELKNEHARNPSLISLSISGFHPRGPGAQRKAYDLLMQAESGLCSITGAPIEAGRVGVSIVDLATGMYAYEAVLESLLARANHGQGERLNVALFDAVAEWMTVPYLLERYGAGAPKRVGLAHPGICPYGVFESKDGVRFILSIQNEREWRRLCAEGLRHDDLAQNARCIDNETRVRNRAFVDGEVAQVITTLNYDEVDARFAAADLAFAPLNQVSGLVKHADFHTESVSVGKASIELPVVPGRRRPQALRIPELGSHTDTVKAWLNDQG